jgi:hypothetical protein
LDFIGHYDVLVDDKEAMSWIIVGRFAIPISKSIFFFLLCHTKYLTKVFFFFFSFWAIQEKIAGSLITKEQVRAISFFRKFFAGSSNLHLLQRRLEEWRNLQSDGLTNFGVALLVSEEVLVVQLQKFMSPPSSFFPSNLSNADQTKKPEFLTHLYV